MSYVTNLGQPVGQKNTEQQCESHADIALSGTYFVVTISLILLCKYNVHKEENLRIVSVIAWMANRA